MENKLLIGDSVHALLLGEAGVVHAGWSLVNPRRACASEGYSSWFVCLSVCLSGLNLLLHASRATRYYTYVYFTMNARFNMCGVR